MSYPPVVLLSIGSTLLPFLVGTSLLKPANKRSQSTSFLWIFFAFAAVIEITAPILTSRSFSSAWISHIYTLIEYVLITIILVPWQTNNTLARLMRLSISVYILIFVLIKLFNLENFSAETVNYITRPLALLLLTTFALLTLQNLWRNTSTNLTDDYRFWMLFAMALYYSTSLGLFAFMYTKNQELLIALFKMHAVINIIHNLLFTIGVFKVRAAQRVALEPSSSS